MKSYASIATITLSGLLVIVPASTLPSCATEQGTAAPFDPYSYRVLPSALTALTPLATCTDVEREIREQALLQMNAAIDEELEQIYYRDPNRCPSNSDLSGSAPPTASAPSTAPQSVSTTNNQVAAVDEADFVKNDSKYIYTLANGAFRIIEAWPATTMREIAKVQLEGTPKKLFVHNDRALVYVSSSKDTTSSVESAGARDPRPPSASSRPECTYGYDCSVGGDGTSTSVFIFDITNRANPTLSRTITLSGSLIAARRIDNTVHTVVSDEGAIIPNVVTYLPASGSCRGAGAVTNEALRAQYEKLRARNTEIIAKAPLTGLPRIADSLGSVTPGSCNSYYAAKTGDGSGFTSVVSLDMVNAGPLQPATIISRPGTVYASGEALYMAIRHERSSRRPWFDGFAGSDSLSTIHKFRIGAAPNLTAYAASGVVQGRALNSFALDEYKGNLRIATTIGHLPSPTAQNQLSILEQAGSSLNVIGKIERIAPTEDIRSVRFDGDRGFMVTFKKTDPLYAFDLKDPRAPRITGELKIPGFSTYMHMMDEQHLLTIGYDAKDQGNFAFFDGILLQIFNISNPANPTLAFKQTIGTRGSSSEALTNHLAFTYFAPKSVLAIPTTICEGGDANFGQYASRMTFSGLMVFDTSVTSGFRERGRVTHPATNPQGCNTWWTNANSEVQRSIFMDDFVFSISASRIKVNHLNNLNEDVAAVTF